jgi:hypothetical protein
MPLTGQNRPNRPSFPTDGSAVHSSICTNSVQLYRRPGFLNSAPLVALKAPRASPDGDAFCYAELYAKIGDRRVPS